MTSAEPEPAFMNDFDEELGRPFRVGGTVKHPVYGVVFTKAGSAQTDPLWGKWHDETERAIASKLVSDLEVMTTKKSMKKEAHLENDHAEDKKM